MAPLKAMWRKRPPSSEKAAMVVRVIVLRFRALRFEGYGVQGLSGPQITFIPLQGLIGGNHDREPRREGFTAKPHAF